MADSQLEALRRERRIVESMLAARPEKKERLSERLSDIDGQIDAQGGEDRLAKTPTRKRTSG